MEKWVEIRKSADFMKMAADYGISPIVARILRNRDLVTPSEINSYLSPGESPLNDPMMLKGMDRVIFVLNEKIKDNKKIRIIGDYDVDGICATFILYKGLSFFKAKVDYCIPHRIEDGYGINAKLIKDAYDSGADTIITCDNGISAIEQTEYAKSLGLTMLITDHHEVMFEEKDGVKRYIIPDADAVVDPKLPGCEYPFLGICGAYVAYQTISALAGLMKMDEDASFLGLKEELTEFASLATVCDVMELRGENRALVYRGSRLMADSKNLGMRSLISVTGMEGRLLTPYHMGFVIGPCLNASGRLDTSLRALELFTEKDSDAALKKAEDLKALNEERKQMTIDETEKAFAMVDEMEKPDKVLVIYLPDCHESLAGIIAGRVRERYFRPAFVVTRTENGLKGSGRSIEAYDMFESLLKVKDNLTKFGGHKLAAGISLSEDRLESFREELNANCTLSEDDFYDVVRIDMELPLEYATLDLARELYKLEPFGNGNEKPVFAIRGVSIINGTRIGKNKNVGKYKVRDKSGRIYEMVYFGNPDLLENFVESVYGKETALSLHQGVKTDIVLDILYQVEVNTFRGTDSVQLQIKSFR